MKNDQEKLFFEHDLATPLTNLRGALYLLKLYLPNPSPEIAESLGILASNTRTLERMLGWYWRTLELGQTISPEEPWDMELLPGRILTRITEEKLPIHPPEGRLSGVRTTLPRHPLETGLLGATLTLLSAAKTPPGWAFQEEGGKCLVRWTVEGDKELLDPERLFRKVFIPSYRPVEAWLDAGLPYLKALLDPFGGSLALKWREERWVLEAVLPAVQ